MGGFDLSPVPQNLNDLQYNKYNGIFAYVVQ